MIDPSSLRLFLYGWLGLAVATFVALLFVDAPYGRHGRKGWGPELDATLGWIVMEAVSPLLVLACFLAFSGWRSVPGIAFLALWLLHYVHRAFIYPLRRRSVGQRMPVSVALMAIVFNGVNASTNGLSVFGIESYPARWLLDPRFLLGVAVFAFGFFVNQHADWVLLHLRKPGETGYRIPFGGLYRWVSSPNYLGEMLEWIGWAIATWSLAGLAFAAWTVANLLPRALANHRWYRERFPDYPPERRAIIPFVW